MWREVLLEVKVGYSYIRWWLQKILQLVVEDELAAVFWVLESLFSDILINRLGDLGSGNEFAFGKTQEPAQLRRYFLFSVESIVRGASLSLLTVRVFLRVFDLAYELGEGLDLRAEGGKFGLNSFQTLNALP